MRVAHSIAVRPRCGLYSSTRTLVGGERAAGIDAWFVPLMGFSEPEVDGIPCSLELKECNVIVSHSGISPVQAASGIPVIHVLHSQPRYKMKVEVLHPGVAPFYSVRSRLRTEGPDAFLTFYPEHLPYWELALPGRPVYVIPPPVDLDRWSPDGPADYDFGGKGGTINVVAADTWRATQDPFDLIHAFALFAKEHPGAKLHIYGIGDQVQRCGATWAGVFAILEEMGALGETVSWSFKMRDIYRSADMVLSNQRSANNVMREALACGCPVVADLACKHTPWVADIGDPPAYAMMMSRLWDELARDRATHRQWSRAYAEDHFDGLAAGKAFAKILHEVADGSTATICSPSRTWYEDGLQFECQPGCTYCCTHGGTVRLLEREMKQITEHVGEDVSHHFVQTATGWEIVFSEDGACPFVTSSGCSVYPARPTQDSAFPFWAENLQSRATWDAVAKWCPGINKGPLHTVAEIQQGMHDYSVMQLHTLGERPVHE